MTKTLAWSVGNDAELDINDDMSVAMYVSTFKKIESLMSKRGETKGMSDMGSALD